MSTSTTATTEGSATPTFLSAGRHPVNIGHLVTGVALAGMCVVWALVVSDVVDGGDVRWLLPLPWLLAGAAGLAGLVASERRKVGARRQGWVGPPAEPDDAA